MLPAEIYEVEFFDAEAVEARRLPARVAPLPDEALPSWLLRFANPFGVSPEALLLGDGEADLAAHPEWWRKPDPLLVAALARGAGVTNDDVRSLTFAEWPDNGRDDALPERFSRQRFTVERPTRQTRRIGVCPDCLAEDDIPYIRRAWTLGWLAACPEHSTVLVRACPECGTKLRLPALSSRDHFAPDRCPRCAFRLARSVSRPAPEPVVRFQQRVLSGRQKGIVDLPEVGVLAWPVAVALFDVLLGAVWIDTKPFARNQLSARIARDLRAEPFGEIAEPIRVWRSSPGCSRLGRRERKLPSRSCARCGHAVSCCDGPTSTPRSMLRSKNCCSPHGQTEAANPSARGGELGSTPCRRLATICARERLASGCRIGAPDCWRSPMCGTACRSRWPPTSPTFCRELCIAGSSVVRKVAWMPRSNARGGSTSRSRR